MTAPTPRPMTGLDGSGVRYDDARIGDAFASTMTITETHLVLGAGLVGDFNPHHVSETYARGARYGGRILHGVITSAIMGAPLGMYRRDFGMLLSLFKLTVADRYLGSGLGLIWAVLSPLFLMGIFTFVFTFVFPGRLPGREGAIPYVVWLLSGYGPWLAISEGLSASTTSVVGNAGIVKNVAFKSELLPVVGALTGLFPLLVSLAVIVVLFAVSGETPNPVLLFLPVSLFLGTLFVSGLGLFLAALNVFVRDTALALPNVLTLLLFASPIFYPLSAYPAGIAKLLQFNPFYVIAAMFRAPIIDGALPPLWMFIYLAVVSTAVFAGGLMWFRRLKSSFDARL